MSILELPGQPARIPGIAPEPLIVEQQQEDGSTRFVHKKTGAFLAFLINGSFMLRDAFGSEIMSDDKGNIRVRAVSALVLSGKDVILEDDVSHAQISMLYPPDLGSGD